MIPQQKTPQGSLLVLSAISSHLRELNYPEKSISSMNRCGALSGYVGFKVCGCGTQKIPFTHKCNLRVCPNCAKTRKRRIFKRFVPFFNLYKTDKANFFQFLTISPKNYDDLEYGFADIKKNFNKFLRRAYSFKLDDKGKKVVDEYIMDRIKAGFYVLECKKSDNDTWNIHIHAILYGRWLDYRIRGQCLECGQNLMKFNKNSKKYYCANRNCNSLNVAIKKDTKLGSIWKSVTGESAHIYGERVKTVYGAVAYLTKYISADKENFVTNKDVAQYISVTHKKKLINSFGIFSANSKIFRFHYKFLYEKLVKKRKDICMVCDEEIEYYFDVTLSNLLMNQEALPPDLTYWF